MPLTASLALCISVVASHYHVPKERLEGVMRQESAQPTVGAAHIPVAWNPLLKSNGFDLEKVEQDPCQSVAAAGWILAYSVKIMRIEQDMTKPVLPARAQIWQPYIAAYSQAAGIDPRLVNAVILQESRFRTDARSPADAYGLMQLTGPTAKTLGVNRYDPRQNLWGGIWYLSSLHKMYDGDLAKTLAAYNAGPTAVAKWKGIPPYKETMAYVPSVISHYNKLLQVAQNGVVASPVIDGRGR